MTSEELVQLAGSGNAATVEEEWMKLLEKDPPPTEELASLHVVLKELANRSKKDVAETLAWSAVEAVRDRRSAKEALIPAGSFLLAIGDSQELRTETANLYRLVYGDRENLEGLMKEAGIERGRPVRRALRTLDVALDAQEGGFAVARHDERAIRIEQIDTSDWQFSFTDGKETQALGAVHFADEFQPTDAEDFRVLRQFRRDELLKRMGADPASLLIELCRARGGRVDAEQIEALLVPCVMTADAWKKWFMKARTAAKKNPCIKLEGRSPVVIHYIDSPSTREDLFTEAFEAAHEPGDKLDQVEQYVRDCKALSEQPSRPALQRCCDQLLRLGSAAAAPKPEKAMAYRLAARYVGALAEVQDAAGAAIEQIRSTSASKRLEWIAGELDHEVLIDLACETLIDAHPRTWQDDLMDLVPLLPQSLCDKNAQRLLKSGRSVSDLQPVVDRIIAEPIDCFDALLWLWDGPSAAELCSNVRPVTLLSRILRALEDARLSDKVSKEKARRMNTRGKSVLSARKCERFIACVKDLGAGLGSTIRNQLRRTEALGQAVRQDLNRLLDHHCPLPRAEAQITPLWELDDVLFVTQQGFARKQEEIDCHVNVKMRENAEAIGRAAEHGDLSENSEYKFALEERDLLRARLAQMNAEMAKVRVLTASEVLKDRLSIGSRVIFEKVDNGHRYEMSILGPWDADPDKCRFNYLAPICKEILGKRIGDIVELTHVDQPGEYRLAELYNLLEDMQRLTDS